MHFTFIYLMAKDKALIIIIGELAITGVGGTLILKGSEKHLYKATELFNNAL